MKMKQVDIAQKLGMTSSAVSMIFRGRASPGKVAAQKLAAITGRDWTDYLKMTGPEIEKDVRSALEPKEKE